MQDSPDLNLPFKPPPPVVGPVNIFSLGQLCSQRRMEVAFGVVSYNVLSSSLADRDRFTHCDPVDLVAATRLVRVRQKLQEHVDASSVICLQELSREWCGDLHSFFQQQGYSLVSSMYGGSFTGYMGVGIAFPNAKWCLRDCDISRVSDTKVLCCVPRAYQG